VAGDASRRIKGNRSRVAAAGSGGVATKLVETQQVPRFPTPARRYLPTRDSQSLMKGFRLTDKLSKELKQLGIIDIKFVAKPDHAFTTSAKPITASPSGPDGQALTGEIASTGRRLVKVLHTIVDTLKAGEEQAQAEVILRAEQVIGDRADAMRWLGTPVRALGYSTPISLLHDTSGREEVLAVLGRLEHGVL
jgi:hypothetical protein